MALGRPKKYAQKVVKKWSPPKREPAQEEPKTLQNIPLGPAKRAPGSILPSLGSSWAGSLLGGDN